MKQVILLKVGELILKGLNRRSFEDVLIKNIRRRVSTCGDFEIKNVQSTIYLVPKNSDANLYDALEKVKKIFGIASISIACQAEKNMDEISSITCDYFQETFAEINSFKVEAKRSDKKFPLKSPEICAELGGRILEKFPHLKVDVHNPDIVVMVEIRDFAAYVHGNAIKGAGGIPVGTGGKAAVLISGGIDSPVASWMMAKRGVELTAIHFASPPYTSERAEKKVCDLLKKVSLYSGRINMFTVPFTEIQETIHKDCPEELFTIIMRRVMFRISNVVAKKNECSALVTGESLGQVASQTIGAISCVDACAEMPVFRPLIGMDKDEIVSIARKIDTFDISIQPFEDCCTVFTPRHPRTRPILKYVLEAEKKISLDELIQTAIENVKLTKIF